MAQSTSRNPDAGQARGLPSFDASVANPARMWDYWIGGKDNFAADRVAAEEIKEAMPSLPVIARLVRRFLIGAVDTLAADYGIRQFLDVGSGLPTANNTHDAAQAVAPESRVVYVDHDPVVISHSRALLSSNAEGKTAFVHADLRDTSAIITQAAQILDFTQPVAVMLIAVLHFIPDHDDPYAVVRRLMDAVPTGSFLVLAHAASDIAADAGAEMARRYNARSPVPITLRSRDQTARFFDGMEMLDPGLAPLVHWWDLGRADVGEAGGLIGYCGIGRKPLV